MKICFFTCLIPQVLGSPVSGAYYRRCDDLLDCTLEGHFYNSLVLWYIAEKQVEHVHMSFSVVANTTTLWRIKWDPGIAWSVVGRRAVCGSMLLSLNLQERRLSSFDSQRFETSRVEERDLLKFGFLWGWPCVCEISECFVGLRHPMSRSLVIGSKPVSKVSECLGRKLRRSSGGSWTTETGTHTKLAKNMADSSVPSWPIIINKSLEESEIYRLLRSKHKVRGMSESSYKFVLLFSPYLSLNLFLQLLKQLVKEL